MLDRDNTFETNSLTFSIFQPQENGLVHTLASILLQRIPSPRNARGGLSQRRISQGKRRTRSAKKDKVVFQQLERSTIPQEAHYNSKFQRKSTKSFSPIPCPRIQNPQPLQLAAVGGQAEWLK